jgi:hypothetical protein
MYCILLALAHSILVQGSLTGGVLPSSHSNDEPIMLIEVPKKVSINLITSTEIGPLFVDFRHFHGRIERQFFVAGAQLLPQSLAKVSVRVVRNHATIPCNRLRW